MSKRTGTSGTSTPDPSRRSFAPFLGALAVAAIVIGVVSIINTGGDDYVQPPVIASSVDESAQALLRQLSVLAEEGAGTGIGPDGDILRVANWHSEYLPAGDASVSGADAADDSRNGTTKPAQHAQPEWTETAAPTSDLPTDASEIGVYLTEYLGLANLSTADYFLATRSLMSKFLVTASQESALLTFLSERDDLEVLGKTTDRAGREAAVFLAANDPFQYLLLVSTTTGAVLGLETVYVGPELDGVRSPSVVDFTIWER